MKTNVLTYFMQLFVERRSNYWQCLWGHLLLPEPYDYYDLLGAPLNHPFSAPSEKNNHFSEWITSGKSRRSFLFQESLTLTA